MSPSTRRLHACWTAPEDLGPDDAVLSFLPPAEEEALARQGGPKLLRARELSGAIQERARSVYMALCAEPAASGGDSGLTLRQEAAAGEAISPWWYHPVSFHDCESDPAYGRVIAALMIQDRAKSLGAESVVLWGACPELARCLAPVLKIEVRRPARSVPMAWWWLHAAAARVRFGLKTLAQIAAARRLGLSPEPGREVFLAGFWDWSFWAQGDSFEDRYYKGLPKALATRGLKATWLAWLDPEGNPGEKSRPLSRVLAPLKGRRDTAILQAYLTTRDVLAAVMDLRPLRAYQSQRRTRGFRSLFRREGLDFFPLFEERLLRGFLDGCLPRGRLVALAAERASRALQPRILVSFLEHFIHARALYAGVRKGGPVLCAAVQHSSFCRQKTFYFVDSKWEYSGSPDGLALPCPDHVFAMGRQGRDHFLSCGYPPERVHLTGSPRYDHMVPRPRRSPPPGPLKVLVATSWDLELGIDMVEAVAAAARGLPGVEVTLRSHPFSRVTAHPRFAPLKDRVALSKGSLEKNLEESHLLLFDYSTVAEEAALSAVPAWQWLSYSYNASALAEACPPPQFSSAASLRAALAAGRAEPLPEPERAKLEEALFFRMDGGAAARVAEAIARLVRPGL